MFNHVNYLLPFTSGLNTPTVAVRSLPGMKSTLIIWNIDPLRKPLEVHTSDDQTSTSNLSDSFQNNYIIAINHRKLRTCGNTSDVATKSRVIKTSPNPGRIVCTNQAASTALCRWQIPQRCRTRKIQAPVTQHGANCWTCEYNASIHHASEIAAF